MFGGDPTSRGAISRALHTAEAFREDENARAARARVASGVDAACGRSLRAGEGAERVEKKRVRRARRRARASELRATGARAVTDARG